MSKRSFSVRAVWDDVAKVFYSESDIEGLHIETADLDEFESVLFEVAPGLIIANHITGPEFASVPLKDLIPAIVWERPAAVPA